MALILKDRVKETSSSSGTGSITLGGAFPGYQTFNAAIANGSTVYYTIHNLTAGDDDEWEVGLGTFTSPATLARTTVLSSSAGAPTKTNFTAGASGLEVFITQPAEEAVYLNNATGLVEIGGNGTNTVSFTNINTTNLTATTVTLTNGTITTNAANATDITNKQYVDGLVSSGIHFHEPVLVEEDVALVAVYAQPNGASNGVGATLTNNAANAALVVDGVSVSNTARILVYAQANAVQNGVYTVTNPGNASAQWVLTRATDADTFGLTSPDNLGEGSTFFVSSGNTGAGRTYTCNTTGTITFGTTDITFAQISSSQIYSAGTGLNLSNLTFSISNTAVTAAQYGNDGAVGQFTVNAQGQLTNAANVSINASSISVGTLANGRTTAASANGASTIVARDSNGDFTANTITATTSNATTFNGTTGAFTNVSGNGVALTAINASNIASGTIDNARTTGNTANSASTIVLRDTNGSFGANIISGAFSGDGSAINAINASNISSGTIANARTSAASANGASTIVLRDGSGGFGAGDITSLSISGNGVALTAINASNIASGTIDNARTSASSSNGASTIVLRGASGEFAAGAITGTSFSGDGSAVSAINGSNVTTGTVAVARGGTGANTLTANNVVLGNGTSAVQFVAPGTTGNILTSDGTTWTSAAAGGGFAAGTVMLFAQNTAPTGWTKNVSTGDNSALRVTTGAASTGGSVGFTTAFASQAVTGTIANQTATNQAFTPSGSVSITAVSGSAGNTTLTIPQIPSHNHPGPGGGCSSPIILSANYSTSPSGTGEPAKSVFAQGGGGAHSHPFSFSSGSGTFSGSPATVVQNAHNHTFTGTAINLAVQYIDVIRATKD
jgi:hypothetical protein